MPNNKIKRITLPDGQTYDIDLPSTATPNITSLETSYTDNTNNTSGYRGLLAQRKVYTGALGVANGSSPNNNTYANQSVYFLTVHPKDWFSQWTIHYHLNIHLDDETATYKSSASASVIQVGQLERGTYDCTLSGTGSAYSVFHMFQSQKNTSYRPIYYHMLHGPTQAGHNNGAGYKIGVCFYASYLSTPTTDYSSGSAVSGRKYTRTIEVIIDDCVNCTAELNDTLEVEADAYRSDYTKLNSTYYAANTSASNSAGRWVNLAATTQGLYESSDDNTYTYTQQTYNYLKNGTAYSDGSAGYILGYPLVGFDKDGKALAISKRTPTATSYDASVQTTRVYCSVGFDYTKGLRYISTSSNFVAGADINMSTQINYSGLDFRYVDNCVASATANSLGMINRQPVYLRGTIGSDGLFYLAPIEVTYNNNTYKRAWVQPNDGFETGYVYWFIGYPYYNSSYANSLYQFNLVTQGELSYYDGTQLRPYSSAALNVLTTNTDQEVVSDKTINNANRIIFASNGGNASISAFANDEDCPGSSLELNADYLEATGTVFIDGHLEVDTINKLSNSGSFGVDIPSSTNWSENKTMVTSINNINADANGNVAIDLPQIKRYI